MLNAEKETFGIPKIGFHPYFISSTYGVFSFPHLFPTPFVIS